MKSNFSPAVDQTRHRSEEGFASTSGTVQGYLRFMEKLIRILHDLRAQAATRIGAPLRRATEAELNASSSNRWTLQQAGCRTLPNTLEAQLNPGLPDSIEMRWCAVDAHEIHHAHVTGDDCNVFLPNGRFLGDCSSLAHHPDRKIRRPIPLLSRRIQEVCFLLGGRNFENHGHFMLHHLPRLAAAMDHLKEHDVQHLLLGHRRKGWQERYIRSVSGAAFSVLRAGPGTTRVDRLLHAPQLWSETALASPEILHTLRNAFLAHSENEASLPKQSDAPPILVSRDDAPDRQLLNERNIAAEIERQWGRCEILKLSNLSFADQIRAFSQAPLIVGALGQGFANLLAANGALCLILDTEPDWAESYFSRTFRDLAILNGCLASRVFANTPIKKRDHWTYPEERFKTELLTATKLWQSNHPSPKSL